MTFAWHSSQEFCIQKRVSPSEIVLGRHAAPLSHNATLFAPLKLEERRQAKLPLLSSTDQSWQHLVPNSSLFASGLYCSFVSSEDTLCHGGWGAILVPLPLLVRSGTATAFHAWNHNRTLTFASGCPPCTEPGLHQTHENEARPTSNFVGSLRCKS